MVLQASALQRSGFDVIYLDNNASTAIDPAVLETVLRTSRDLYGNPSSSHIIGLAATRVIEVAREQLAALVSCDAREVVFTSGATEADSLALRGLWEATRRRKARRDTIIVGATEHHAVLESATSLRALGARVLLAPVDQYGVTDLAALEALVGESGDRLLMISIMAANNETGTLHPLNQIVQLAEGVGAFVHTDATQQIGRLPLNFSDLNLDLLSLSSHKMHGPKGVGALVVRRTVPMAAQLHGGGQERGLRSGTLNTPGIVGLGIAAELACKRFSESARIADLRDDFYGGLLARLPDILQNGHPPARLPNTLNVRFVGAEADAVMASLREVVCSSGSACMASSPTPSHVLLAMGMSREAASESLRFSLSRTTTATDIATAVEDIVEAVNYVRSCQLASVVQK